MLDDGVGYLPQQVDPRRLCSRSLRGRAAARQELPERHMRVSYKIAAAEKTVLAVERDEQIIVSGNVLRQPEEKMAARLQGIMKHRNNLRLERGFQIDQ